MNLKMYSIDELTGILNLHPKTILRFIHEGKIAARKIGRNWMVTEDDLKTYCHMELSADDEGNAKPEYSTLKNRITVSAVVEISEQNSEEASRISNTMHAMLNSEKGSNPGTRFDFFYFPESGKAKYVFYGSPSFIEKTMGMFDVLARQE